MLVYNDTIKHQCIQYTKMPCKKQKHYKEGEKMEFSYLFVPGNQPERISKALKSSADAVIIDLEDSIALTDKQRARESVASILNTLTERNIKIYIRMNDLKTDFWQEDVELINQYPFLGILLPMIETKQEITDLNRKLLSKHAIIPIIETAKGVHFAYEIAIAASNIKRLAFGALDYCLDLNINIEYANKTLDYTRNLLVIASRAAKLESPVDSVFSNFKDDNGLRKELQAAKRLGLFAKLCIHPRQLDIVNSFFIPTQEEIAWAKKVVKLFVKAEEKGIAAINVNGKMVDYPVYKQAKQILVQINKAKHDQ